MRDLKLSKRERKIPEDDYYAIVIGRHNKYRVFWRNLLFKDHSVAMFYLEQEAFALERAKKNAKPDDPPIESDVPIKYTLEDVHEWEIEDKMKDLNVFDLPIETTAVICNYDITRSMTVKMVLHDDNFENLYYSGRFGFLGHNEHHELVGDHFKERVSEADSLLFGVRMRPAIQSTLRKNYFSMCGDGLPGLWYINMGERIEIHCAPKFGEYVP